MKLNEEKNSKKIVEDIDTLDKNISSVKDIEETEESVETFSNENEKVVGKEVSETKEITRSPKEHFAKNETEFKSKKTQNQRPRTKIERKQAEFEDKIIDVARVTTVVKGGRRFSFSATVAIGNKKGKVGIGHGKANEVPDAIKKAFKNAENNLIEVPIINKSTIPHEIKAKYLASRILLKPAPKGKGIIASGTARTVVELAGYTDIYTKSYGSRTKQNAAKVVMKALQQLKTAEKVATLRDIPIKNIIEK